MIKAIAFDWGGVCTTEDWGKEVDKNIALFLKIPVKKVTRLWQKHWTELKKGKTTEETVFKKLLMESNESISLNELKKFYYSLMHVNDEVIKLIKELKKNYKVFALSNVSKETASFKLKKFKFKELFNGFILSGFVGIAKPDKKIYQLLLKKARVKGKEMVFVDNHENRLPSKELQINSIVFKSLNQLKKDLKKLGVKMK